MRKQRKHCTAKEQVVILRRHFLEKVRVSDLCEELHCSRQCFTLAKGFIRERSSRPSVQPSPRAPAAAEAERDRILAEKSPDLKMLDADVVAVSPASVWRVLKQDGLLLRSKGKASRRRIGFEQPLQPHQAWHIDVSYINLF